MEAYQEHGTSDSGVGRLERAMYRNERWMYRGARPNRLAAALNAVWARVGAAGLGRDRLVTLEVTGRRSGRPVSVPLIVADHAGERYLVAMLGERADWVANVRAAGGRAVLRHGRREPVQLDEVEPIRRGPIVRRHLQVAPAARSFVPVATTAPAEALDRVARHIPVFRVCSRPGDERMTAGNGPRARHRRRWILAVVAALVIVSTAGLLVVGTRSGPPPLTLPVSSAQPPVGPLDGRWSVADGSTAGFRVDQIVLGMHAAVVGRTPAVSGSVDIAGTRVTGASFAIDLTTLSVNGKVPAQIAISLDTAADPVATVELARPVVLPTGLAAGGPVTTTATGVLTLRGVAHAVTISLNARRDGDTIQVAGSMPVAFAGWGIEGPAGLGALGSLDDHGVAEFLVVLRPADG